MWDDFDNIYIDFVMEYSQQLLTHTLALEHLDDFPNNLPPHLIIPLIAKRHEILTAEMKQRGEDPEKGFPAHEDDFFKEAATIPMTPRQNRIGYAYQSIYNMARLYRKMPEMEYPQFDRILMCQNIIVICAYAEGFIAKTLRKLCEVCPAYYDRWRKKRSRKISGLSVPEAIDQFVFEMGYGNFDKKLSRMEDEFNFRIQTSKKDRKQISELFLIRNCIIHNAGLISKAYKQSGRAIAHLKVGDEVPLPMDYIEKLIDTLVDAVFTIYKSISLDILKKPISRLVAGSIDPESPPEEYKEYFKIYKSHYYE